MDHLSEDTNPRWTLRRRLVAMIGAPLLVTFCVVIAVQFDTQRELLIDSLRKETLADVLASSMRFDGEFQRVSQAVDSRVAVLAWTGPLLTPLQASASQARIMQFLRDDLVSNPFIFGAALAFTPGTSATGAAGYAPYVCRTLSTASDANPHTSHELFREWDIALTQKYEEQPWFLEGASHPRGFWTEPYFDEGGGDILMVTFTQAVAAHDGFPAAVATADISLREIRRWLKASSGNSSAFAIVSTKDQFVSFPKSSALLKGFEAFDESTFEHAVLTAAVAFRGGGAAFARTGSSNAYSLDGTRMVFVTMPTTGWIFVGFFPEATVVPEVLRAIAFGPGVVLLGVLVALTVVWFGASAVVKPLRSVTAALAHFGRGDLSARAPATNRRDEIGALSRAFNRMGDALQSAITERESATAKRLAVEAQVGAARAIQRLLLPASSREDEQENMRSTNEFSGLLLTGYSEPAGEIAGDFFDWFARADGTIVVMIADVCGKGMAAAMMMAVSRTLLRTTAMEASEPSDACEMINRDLIAQAPATKFTTGILLYINTTTGVIRYSNAGHPLPLLVALDGSVREVMPATGTVLGIQQNESWTTGSLTLGQGESLVLFTDGVTEAMVSDDDVENMFGPERAIAAVRAARTGASGARSGEEAPLVQALVAAVKKFTRGNRHDDLTVVTVTRT